MAFYIEPPKGDISINQLENWALKRLRLLLDVIRCHGDMEAVKKVMENPSSAARSDCLIEGTAKDAVSHFILRLACSNDPVCAKVFFESETTLFMHRFMSLNELELVCYLDSLRRFQKQLKKHLALVKDSIATVENVSVQFSSFTEDIYLFFKMLTENFKWKDLIHFYYVKSQKHFIKLPFKFALEMVAKRDVTLHRGNALVPCAYVAQLLGWFFQNWLNYGIKLAKYQHNRVVQDSRMKGIFTICRQTIYKRCQDFDVVHGHILGGIAASDVDVLEKYFPPCMRHLLQSLRRNHRLKHYSRVAFLLFLKDLGLPVSEAIVFWRNEYSQPIPVDASYRGCRHSWQKEKNRFLYSIQHLYGIRGSRQKYSSHLCKYIQNNNWGPVEEAFCPFKHLDDSKFNQFLKSESLSSENSSEIQEMVAGQKFSLACTTFLKAKVHGEMRATTAVNNANVRIKEYLCDNADVRIKECLCDEESGKILSNFERKALSQTSFASSKLNFEVKFSDSATAKPHSNFSFEMDVSKKRMLHLAHPPAKKFIKAESSNFSVKCLNSDADQQYSIADTCEKPCFPECEIDGFNLFSLPSIHGALARDLQVDSGYEGSTDICLSSRAAETDVSFVSKSVNQISSMNDVTVELDTDNQFDSGFATISRNHYKIVQRGSKSQSLTNDLNTTVSLPTVSYNKSAASDSIKPIDLISKVICGKCCSCNKIKYFNVIGDSSSIVNLCSLSEMNGSSSKEGGKFQNFCKSELNYRAKEIIRKPIDFFRTYNILVKEFQSASNIFQN